MKKMFSFVGGCFGFLLFLTIHARADGPGGATITNLPALGGSFWAVTALNSAGQIAGYSYIPGDSEAHAFLYSNGATYDLGTLGGTFAEGLALNSAGHVVGDAYLEGDAAAHAFLFAGGPLVDLGTLGGVISVASAINDAGQIVGYSYLEGNFVTEAFLYQNGLMTNLGSLGGAFGGAVAINQAGLIAGYSTTTNNETRAVLYANGTPNDLGTLGGNYSYVSGLNEAGMVAGESTISNGNLHAFTYSGGVMTDLGTLGGLKSRAFAVNNSGQVIGTSTTTNFQTHGFVYAGGVMIDLTLGGTSSKALAINNLGQVVGISKNASGIQRAFLWQNGTIIDLNTLLPAGSGWDLEEADFINDAGRIVGFGTHDGTWQTFILDLSAAQNRPPVAVAGLDQTVECGSPASLDGSNSSDPDGDALAYQWSEGPLVLGTNSTLTVDLDLGTHTLTLTVTDPLGESDQANVLVHVVDTVSPVIQSAPGSLTAAADANCQAAVPNVLFSVVASDNCTAADQLVLTQNPAAGTLVGRGSHTIVVTATDASGHSTTANVSFAVVDLTAPAILSMPDALRASADANCQAAVPNVLSAVAASDNCTPADQLLKTQTPPAGTLLGRGEYSITVTVTDASGNQSSQSIPFAVVDTTAPVIQSVSATPNTLSPPNGSIVTIAVSVVASDNCDSAPVRTIISITSNEPVAAGDIQITGDLTAKLAADRNGGGGNGRVYTITVQATDASGNSSTATTTVLVPKGGGNGGGKKK